MELKVDGKRVFAATGGRPFDRGKPAILFLHGAGMDHSVWQLPARWFAWHGYSALAVDLPGHGRSEGPPLTAVTDLAQWLARLLDATGIEQAALVGHSMGAAIALETAAALGRRIVRLGLLGTAATIPVNEALLAAAREEPQRAYRMMTAWAHDTSAKLGGHPVPGLWMTGGTMALLARNQTGVLAADLAACHAWASGPEAVRKVGVPALVVVAGNDIMTPPKMGQELGRLLAGSRTVTIPNCGHMLLAEAPDAVLDALIDFFALTEAQ
jgi:pimeloyl-ACP methyl ester carboxylesterase